MIQFILVFLFGIIIIGVKPSIAGIDHYDITDTTIRVYAPAGSVKYYNLDLNNDGTIDFKIGAQCFESWEGYHPPHTAYKMSIRSTGTSQLAIGPFFTNDTISADLNFRSYQDIYGNIPGVGLIGMWAYRFEKLNKDTYVGLSITINGNVYYGWIRMDVSINSFTVYSYAFNNVSNASMLAGQTN